MQQLIYTHVQNKINGLLETNAALDFGMSLTKKCTSFLDVT